MELFNIPKTEEVEILVELSKIDTRSSNILSLFKDEINRAYNDFWFKGADPVKKVQVLGTGALDMFTKSAQAQGFLHLIDPSYTPKQIPEGYTLTWNEDGSATATYTAPVVEEETPVEFDETTS